jgi:hypothetical protein
VLSPKTVVGQGYGANVTVTAADPGDNPETFNVSAYANTTLFASQNVTLASGDSVDITFTWNTTGFVYGNYTISAYAWPVPGETDITNNNYTDSNVVVTIPGDLNGDFKVSLTDLVLVAKAYGTTPSEAEWNPNADINNDGKVSLPDLVIMAENYGKQVTPSTVAQYNETVPSAYESMYATLDQILTVFNQTLTSISTKSSQHPIYATELLPADSNLGQNLLNPNAMRNVMTYLDAFQRLGIEGVTIDVSYPILVSTFPNYTQYLSFYENVVQQARLRNMKIDIESETPILVGYPTISVDSLSYANLTYEEYVSEDKQMIQTVIDNLHPDLLNIGTETDTLQELLNYTQTSTPQGWGSYISSLLSGLDKNTTKIAVGIGSWDPIDYLYSTINMSAIDVIDVHVYPVYGNYLSVLTQIGQLSTQYNKPISIDEMWLHKSVMTEGHGFLTDSSIRQRNVYAFWTPLDETFLDVMAEYAQTYNVTYMSPFECQLFYASLNYDSNTADLSYQQAMQMEVAAAGQNMQNNTISPLGEYYQNLIETSTSPTTPELSMLIITLLFVATFAALTLKKSKQAIHAPHLDAAKRDKNCLFKERKPSDRTPMRYR